LNAKVNFKGIVFKKYKGKKFNRKIFKVCGFICHDKKCSDTESTTCKVKETKSRVHNSVNSLSTISEDIPSLPSVPPFEQSPPTQVFDLIQKKEQTINEKKLTSQNTDTTKKIIASKKRMSRITSWISNPDDAFNSWKAEQEKFKNLNKQKENGGFCQRLGSMLMEKMKKFMKMCRSCLRKCSLLSW
jgi:hypothetical protein